jgi:predicted acetyltransferase
VLKSVASESDVERLAEFNGQIHGAGVASMTRELILHHPYTRPEHWLYVENPAQREIVSSLCLIPWRLSYGDVHLVAGEMGLVGTDEAYRHRGLVRAQAARHAEILSTGGYHLSHIQGIPFFYRQFGYEYAVPLEGGWRLELDTVPKSEADTGRFSFRMAEPTDIPDLVSLYQRAAAQLDLTAARDQAVWRYLLGPSLATEMATETWLVSDADCIAGYIRLPREGFGQGLMVGETSALSAPASRAVLNRLGVWARERAKPFIRLCVPSSTTLVREARAQGAHDIGHYAWQIKLVDVPRLLRRIAPVLERRVADSPFAGLTRSLVVNTYRNSYRISFRNGQLAQVREVGWPEQGDLRLPPALLAPLVLGYRTREELAAVYHDVSASGDAQHLIDVLFPRMRTYLYTAY